METSEPRTRLFRYGTPSRIVLDAAGHSGGHSRPDAVLLPYARALVEGDLMCEVEPGHLILTPDGWESFYAYTGRSPEMYGPHLIDGLDTRVEWVDCPRCGGMGSHWVLKPGRVDADSIADMTTVKCDHCLLPNGRRGKVPARATVSLW